MAVAALWAVHPLATEAVTNLVGRADLLAGLGVFGALLAYIRFREAGTDKPAASRRRRWLLLAIALATLGILSKENGAAVVAVIVLYDLFFLTPRPGLAAMAARWSLFLVPLALFLYQRARVVPPGLPPDPFVDNPIAGSGFWQGRLTAAAVAARYLWLLVWPRTLSSDYSYAQIPLASGSVMEWMSWMATAAIGMAAIILFVRAVLDRRRQEARPGAPTPEQLCGFALIFACATFLPVSNLLITSGTIMAERVMYIPSAGLLAVFVGAVAAAAHAASLPRLFPFAVGAAALLLGVRTVERNPDWQSDLTLWQAAVQSAPRSFKAHQGLADALAEADPDHRQLDRVIAEAEKSLAIVDTLPDRLKVPPSYRRAAGYYLERGDLKRDASPADVTAATTDYQRSVTLTSRYLALVEAAGPVSASAPAPGVPAPAGREHDGTWELSEAYVMLATGHARLQQFDQALDAAQRAHRLQPLNSVPYRVMAASLIDTKRYEEAARWLLAGFMVTGDTELRQATIDLYRGSGDPRGCAIKDGDDGPTLNPACDTVRRDLCAATGDAIRIQSANGRRDLAEQLAAAAESNYGCKPI